MQLNELFAVIAKRRWQVIAVLALAVAAGATFAILRPPRYESTSTLAITTRLDRQPAFVGSSDLTALLSTYAETAKSEVVRQRAARALGRPVPGTVDTSTVSGTGILRVVGRADTAHDAVETARSTAGVVRETISENPALEVSVVDPAELPSAPVQPRLPLIIAVTATLGLVAAVVSALVLERVRRRIETPADIAEISPAPLLASLPRERALQHGPPRLVWGVDKWAGLQEGYRALRTNIEFLIPENTGLIAVTSPEAGRGKSTLVANLGVALAQVGVRTVIVDADLRRPTQHQIFGLDNADGVSTTMATSGLARKEPFGFPNLSVVTAGPAPPDPTEMIHVRFASFAHRLRALGELVIVDSPPVLPVSDARLIAQQCDGALLVVGAGTTRPAALEEVFERLALVRADVLGVVLNQALGEAGSSEGYYYAPSPVTTERRA
jgi:capsular exopolysaccharide synthesis family protein